MHVAQCREVDHDPVVTGREAGDAVPAAADGDREIVASREADRRDHVRSAGAAHDQRWSSPVVLAVPDPSGLLVAGVRGRDDLAAYRLPELFHGRLAKHGRECFGHLDLLPVIGSGEWYRGWRCAA